MYVHIYKHVAVLISRGPTAGLHVVIGRQSRPLYYLISVRSSLSDLNAPTGTLTAASIILRSGDSPIKVC
jgi:hypothetical protein